MIDEACCTCAKFLSAIQSQYDEKTEKPLTYDRHLECCGRFICGVCIARNSRFASYCPFCQISTAPTSSPQRLREPPEYSPPSASYLSLANISSLDEDKLPGYSSLNLCAPTATEKDQVPAEDVLHFLDPAQDTISSLSLRYGVPQDALRRTNGLFADHLLAARRTILIPQQFYKRGVSLSPQPIEGEEEELRKSKVRRWMVACKVSDIPMRLRYNVALLYLQQAQYSLDAAIEAYRADEKWEKDHPIELSSEGKVKHKAGKWKFGIPGLTGQLSA